jgi:hypothetical protein
MATDKREPSLSPKGARASEARKERLAAALRQNLRKRKVQARERAAGNDANSAPSQSPKDE